MSQIIKPDNPFKEASLYLPFNKMSSSRVATNLLKSNFTRGSSKWVMNKNGLLEEVPSGFLGIEYKDGENLGYLAEEDRVNLYEDSTFLNSPSSINGAVITLEESDLLDYHYRVTAPTDASGTRGAVGMDGMGSGVSLSNMGIVTVSYFVKILNSWSTASGGNNYHLTMNFGGSHFTGRSGAWGFNPHAMTVVPDNSHTSDAFIEGRIEEYGHGWYRIQAILDSDRRSYGDPQIYFTGGNQNNDNSATRNSKAEGQDNILIGGFQREIGYGASSYIKTSGSAVTRDPDELTISDAADLIGQTEGRVVLDFEQPEADDIFVAGLSTEVEAGRHRLEFEYSPTEIKLFIDGELRDSESGAYDWSGMDRTEVGHYAGVDQPNSHIQTLGLFKQL